MEKLTTRKQYDKAKEELESLIAEATAKGQLEPDMSNEYTFKIGELGAVMAEYEDEHLNLFPLKPSRTKQIDVPSRQYTDPMAASSKPSQATFF